VIGGKSQKKLYANRKGTETASTFRSPVRFALKAVSGENGLCRPNGDERPKVLGGRQRSAKQFSRTRVMKLQRSKHGFWLLAFLFLAPVGASAQKAGRDYRVDSKQGYVKVPFELYDNNLLVQFRINNSAPIWCLFDTGAGVNILNEKPCGRRSPLCRWIFCRSISAVMLRASSAPILSRISW